MRSSIAMNCCDTRRTALALVMDSYSVNNGSRTANGSPQPRAHARVSPNPVPWAFLRSRAFAVPAHRGTPSRYH